MHQAKDHVDSALSNAPTQPNSESSTAKQGEWTDRVVARMWTYLSELYGPLFVQQFGEVSAMAGGLAATPRRWRGEFLARGLGPREVFAAIQAHLDRDAEGRRGYPPNADDLIGIALEAKRSRPPQPQFYPRLPRPESNPEVALREIERMKAIVAKRRTSDEVDSEDAPAPEAGDLREPDELDQAPPERP